MNGWAVVLKAWDLEPSIVVGCVGLLVAYVGALQWRISRVSGWFVAAVLVLALALLSPLDVLSDTYLFSAHMVQHLLLIVVTPPFLVIGSEGLVRRLLHIRWAARLERVLRRPPIAWVIGVGTLACWHLPSLYNAALASENVHILEHLSFLVSATIFWWPILAPLPKSRTSLVGALLHLVTGTFANGLIGAVLFVLPVSFYPAYIHPPDPLHILPLIRGSWGLSARLDKQLGAVIMIIGGSVAFLYAAFYALWLHRDEGAAVEPSARQQWAVLSSVTREEISTSPQAKQ